MTLERVRELLDAVVLTGDDRLEMDVKVAIAADGMSLVLADPRRRALMITGLTNIQSVRTANVADSAAIVYVRGNRPNEVAIELARNRGIVLISTRLGMFDTCAVLHRNGLEGAT